MFARGGRVVLANDTSCGAGFWPLTDLERVALAVERALNSPTRIPRSGRTSRWSAVVQHGRQTQLTMCLRVRAPPSVRSSEYALQNEGTWALAVATPRE